MRGRPEFHLEELPKNRMQNISLRSTAAGAGLHKAHDWSNPLKSHLKIPECL